MSMGAPQPRIDLIVGARPNFVKVAPVYRALRGHRDRLDVHLVHTGQHYDANMSDVFFADLAIPAPDAFLGVGSLSHGAQTGAIMTQYEQLAMQSRPDLTVVFGDVNSTMACTLAASKLGIPVAHVEAGLRSFDRTMPEEINRVVTDHVADLLFTPSADADEHLRREGIPADRIHFVGNVMIDSLVASRAKIEASNILGALALEPKRYAVATLHRPSNVDRDETLAPILSALESIQARVPIVFPAHPRTQRRLAAEGLRALRARLTNVRIIEPLAYCDFVRLVSQATLVLTDSGGIQEETTYLDVPCVTLRKNTERPITISHGTSVLVGNDTATIVREAERILGGGGKRGTVPPLWDGHAGERIAAVIQRRITPGVTQ